MSPPVVPALVAGIHGIGGTLENLKTGMVGTKPSVARLSVVARAETGLISCGWAWSRGPGLGPPNRRSLGHRGACPGDPRLQSLKRSADFVYARAHPRVEPGDGHDAGSVQKRSVPLAGQPWDKARPRREWPRFGGSSPARLSRALAQEIRRVRALASVLNRTAVTHARGTVPLPATGRTSTFPP